MGLETVFGIVFLLAIVVLGNLAQDFASPTKSVGNIGDISIGDWDETQVVLSPLMF